MAAAVTQIVPITQETRTHISTAAAAHHMLRKNQTLRRWACAGTQGPITPIRINGKLAWPVADIRALLGVA